MIRYKQIKKWITVRFNENLRISDLTKNQGVSNITKKYKKIRSGEIGAESRNVKLIDTEVNKKLNYVKFIFLTEVTPVYGDYHDYEETEPGDYSLHANRSKTYTEEMVVLDFFDWLDTYPDKTEITRKDIKDILEVSDIKLYCSCPSFNYQGMAHRLTTFDAAIYPQVINDKIWGPRHNDDNFLCKHLQGTVNSYKFWLQPASSQLTKKLQNRKLI